MPHTAKIIKDVRYADFSTDCGLFDACLPQEDQPVPVLVHFHGNGLEKDSKMLHVKKHISCKEGG